MATLKEKVKNLTDGINQMSENETTQVTKKFFETILEDYKRHAELEDKLEQNTLIKLPCKLGKQVWFITSYPKIIPCIAREFQITAIGNIKLRIRGFLEEKNATHHVDDWYFADLIGRSIFLTESEAQAELERRSHEQESN